MRSDLELLIDAKEIEKTRNPWAHLARKHPVNPYVSIFIAFIAIMLIGAICAAHIFK